MQLEPLFFFSSYLLWLSNAAILVDPIVRRVNTELQNTGVSPMDGKNCRICVLKLVIDKEC